MAGSPFGCGNMSVSSPITLLFSPLTNDRLPWKMPGAESNAKYYAMRLKQGIKFEKTAWKKKKNKISKKKQNIQKNRSENNETGITNENTK
jgi:hypothetical protein